MPGLVFVGSSTVPGVGVPMVLVSGKLAAARVRRMEASVLGDLTLEVSYAECKRLNKRYGTTYYWSTMLLPSVKRPHVHALYGFCRHADDIVDDDRRRAASSAGAPRSPTCATGSSTTSTAGTPTISSSRPWFTPCGPSTSIREGFARFLRSMEMDLTVERYETWEDLRGYMDGSAAVIGEMMLPILEPTDLSAATGPARALGEAFQLTNFLRDVDEDLDRGRQYLPQEDLRRFGVDLAARRCTPSFVELMRFEIARCRELYRCAEGGIALLPDRSARCIRAAHDLYGRILDRIEAQGYDVFAGRARVSTPRKLAVAARHLTGRVPA